MRNTPPDSTAALTAALEHAPWRKSSRSQGAGADCVELAQAPGLVAIRDSKDPAGPRLTVESQIARAVIEAIKLGHHNL